jgi:hypothetical protein
MMEQTGRIGKSIVIRGELSGHEDLTIEGTVEGKIELKEHHVVVGTTGKIQAEVFAKTVTSGRSTACAPRAHRATSGTVKATSSRRASSSRTAHASRASTWTNRPRPRVLRHERRHHGERRPQRAVTAVPPRTAP